MDSRIHATVLYIEERLNRPVLVDDAASRVGLSPYHFHRLFRRETGESFYFYVKRLRMNGAAARLKWTSDSLLDVAVAFGYSSNAAFSRTFARFFGCSPSEYRACELRGLSTEHPTNGLVTVRELESYRCLARRYHGPYGMIPLHWRDFVDRLPRDLGRSGANARFLGRAHDDPRITRPERMRYDCCCMIADPPDARPVHPDRDFLVLQTRAGRYAMLEHAGPGSRRNISYGHIRDAWLPASGHALAHDPVLEIFRSTPAGNPPDDTDFRILAPLE